MSQRLDEQQRAYIFTQPIDSSKDLVAQGLPPQALEEKAVAPTTVKKRVKWTSDVPKTSELVAKQAPSPKKKKQKRKESRLAAAATRMTTRAAATAEAQGDVGKAPPERNASTNSKSRKAATSRVQKSRSMVKKSTRTGKKSTSEPIVESHTVVTRAMARRDSKAEAHADSAKEPRARKAATAEESGIEEG
jgi:hypothetical protein